MSTVGGGEGGEGGGVGGGGGGGEVGGVGGQRTSPRAARRVSGGESGLLRSLLRTVSLGDFV